MVLGISRLSQEKLARFAATNGISFALGSDPAARVQRLYDVRRRYGLGVARVTYVIDGQGIIRAVYRNEFSLTSHARWALQVVKDLG